MKPVGACFDANWRATCCVAPISRGQASGMIRRHYLGKWPGVVVLSLGLWRRAEPLGVVVYALPPRETNKRLGCEAWELARLWIADEVPQNAETWLIAQSIKYIRRHFPSVGSLISYADPAFGHTGTIYRASNWRYDGQTDDGRLSPRVDYVDADTGKKYGRRAHVPANANVIREPRSRKHRFLYPLGGRGTKTQTAPAADLFAALEAAA